MPACYPTMENYTCSSFPLEIVLVLDGQLIPNNSVISTNDLLTLEEVGTLLCTTTLSQCCDTNRSGNWFSPTGNASLSSVQDPLNPYQSWSDDQTVRLNWPNETDSSRNGLYRCEVPDRDHVTQTLYVGIYSEDESEGLLFFLLIFSIPKIKVWLVLT